MLLGKNSDEHSPLDCVQTLLIWHCGCGWYISSWLWQLMLSSWKFGLLWLVWGHGGGQWKIQEADSGPETIWSWLLTRKYILFHYVHNADPTRGTQDITWSKISLTGSGHLQWKMKWAHTYKIFCFLLRFHMIKWNQWEKTCHGPQCLLVVWKEKTLIASNKLMRFYPLQPLNPSLCHNEDNWWLPQLFLLFMGRF